jgi:hypothetical protein
MKMLAIVAAVCVAITSPVCAHPDGFGLPEVETLAGCSRFPASNRSARKRSSSATIGSSA